jgi:hypothetical protein
MGFQDLCLRAETNQPAFGLAEIGYSDRQNYTPVRSISIRWLGCQVRSRI